MRAGDYSDRRYARQHTFVRCRELQIALSHRKYETYAESFERCRCYDDARDENEHVIECPKAWKKIFFSVVKSET